MIQILKKIKNYKILVATDSVKILNTLNRKDIPCVLTSKKHKSGSDRVAEVARKTNFKWILNLQGDEPLINVNDVKRLINKTLIYNMKDNNFVASTLFVKKKFYKNIKSEVKLIINKKNQVVKFTRKKIFFNNKYFYFKHVGIYLYKSNFLKTYSKLKRSKLEKMENLEQLRILDNGFKIIAFEAKKDSIGIDTPQDLTKLRNI